MSIHQCLLLYFLGITYIAQSLNKNVFSFLFLSKSVQVRYISKRLAKTFHNNALKHLQLCVGSLILTKVIFLLSA